MNVVLGAQVIPVGKFRVVVALEKPKTRRKTVVANIPYYIGCAFDGQDDMDFRKEEARKRQVRKAAERRLKDKEEDNDG